MAITVSSNRDLVTNQGKSVAEAMNQAISQNSPLFDDSQSPPASLRTLGIMSYPDKVTDIDFEGAKRKIHDLAVSGRITPEQHNTLWLDLDQFQSGLSRRDQLKPPVRAIKEVLKGANNC
jgi:hypothetical protein